MNHQQETCDTSVWSILQHKNKNEALRIQGKRHFEIKMYHKNQKTIKKKSYTRVNENALR